MAVAVGHRIEPPQQMHMFCITYNVIHTKNPWLQTGQNTLNNLAIISINFHYRPDNGFLDVRHGLRGFSSFSLLEWILNGISPVHTHLIFVERSHFVDYQIQRFIIFCRLAKTPRELVNIWAPPCPNYGVMVRVFTCFSVPYFPMPFWTLFVKLIPSFAPKFILLIF